MSARLIDRYLSIFILCLTLLLYYFAIAENNSTLNVVLITLNSLRADHLKTYGYSRNTAPCIDNWAKEAVIFEQAIAQSHWTLPSQASLFTSRYVHSHKIYDRQHRLSEQELTLTEILKIYGYKTAAFVGGLDMSAKYGFNQGFDYYFEDVSDRPLGSFAHTVPEAVKWMRKNKNNRFFLFIHGYDVHAPYHNPEPYESMHDSDYKGIVDTLLLDYSILRNIDNNNLLLNGKAINLRDSDINHIVAHYDGGITYADKFIGDFLEELKKLGLSENTLVIITSEHGEELLDHGSFDRFGRKNLYEETIHVPLIIKHPHIKKSTRISHQAQLIDVMPTILDIMGIPINKESQGKSLLPLIENKGIGLNFNRYVYSEADPDKHAIRMKEWKLIVDEGRYELYNIKTDADEIRNLAKEEPYIVYSLLQQAKQWDEDTKSNSDFDSQRIELTETMKKKLIETGYW